MPALLKSEILTQRFKTSISQNLEVQEAQGEEPSTPSTPSAGGAVQGPRASNCLGVLDDCGDVSFHPPLWKKRVSREPLCILCA